MPNINESILSNIADLSEKLCDVDNVLLLLFQEKLITENEKETIKTEKGINQGSKIFQILLKRNADDNWEAIKVVLQKSLNQHLIKIVEENLHKEAVESSGSTLTNETTAKKQIILGQWWPDSKELVNSFLPTKIDGNLLVEKMKNILSDNQASTQNGSKLVLTGLGGTGKSTAAKWYGIHYAKDYDHIIWMDCEKNAFENTFKLLARELGVKDWLELDLHTRVRECFTILADKRCLLIFDNAEFYSGDMGIFPVLPKNENFHSIRTSRHRKWGSESDYGQISEIRLDGFTMGDSLTFLSNTLKSYSANTDSDLRDLCKELGTLPLALQIAVATLNEQQMELVTYIRRVRQANELIGKNTVDYPKSIQVAMTISLEAIQNDGTSGQLATDILKYFSFLSPDDINVEFFHKIMNVSIDEVEVGFDLLESYSLIARQNVSWSKLKFESWEIRILDDYLFKNKQEGSWYRNNVRKIQQKFKKATLNEIDHDWLIAFEVSFEEWLQIISNCAFNANSQDIFNSFNYVWKRIGPNNRHKTETSTAAVCIHRVLQQVIRFNEGKRNADENILRQILTIEGFFDFKYKLIPYMHAKKHDCLRKKFKNIESVFLNPMALKDLCTVGRTNEAVELSRNLKVDLPTSLAAKFNYAICLKNDGQLERCVSELETMFSQMDIEGTFDNQIILGPLDFDQAVHKCLVGGNLFLLYIKNLANWRNKAENIFKELGTILGISNGKNNGYLIDLIKLSELSGYLLNCKGNNVNLSTNVTKRNIILEDCSIGDNIPNDLHELTMNSVYMTNNSNNIMTNVDINQFVSQHMRYLHMNVPSNITLSIDKCKLTSVTERGLENCRLEYKDPINPRTVNVLNVAFLNSNAENGEECPAGHYTIPNVNQINITDAIEGPNIHLSGCIASKVKVFEFDKLKVPLKVEFPFCRLAWFEDIQSLDHSNQSLHQINFRFIIPIKFTNSNQSNETGLQTVKHLILDNCTDILMPNLKLLLLYGSYNNYILLGNCPNLKKLFLDSEEKITLDAKDIPQTVTTLYIKNIVAKGSSMKRLATLQVEFEFDFDELHETLNNVPASNLIILSKIFRESHFNMVKSLVMRKFHSLAIGKFDFRNFKLGGNTELPQIFDIETEYYGFIDSIGKELDEREFKRLLNE